ncbi:MAG TPA: hypothetical protein VD905_05690 [Flavobacteriales bacterium]|nr:hypothetical protein [Flavobacteriales bacterium]
MKRFEYTYVCHKDPEKMPKGDKTRFCNKCSKHIHDFTKMNAAQIAETIKSSKTHCGTMYSWQVDELNEYLDSQTAVRQPRHNFGNVFKAVAVLSTPLIAPHGNAQINEPTYEVVQTVPQLRIVTEILLTGQNNIPLAGVEIKIMDGVVEKGAVKSDINGKLYLEHAIWGVRASFVLKNVQLGIEIPVTLDAGKCFTWKTNVVQSQLEQVTEEKYDFQLFFSKSGKQRFVKSRKVTIEIFDEQNEVIDVYKNETNGAGYTLLKSNKLEQGQRVVFTVQTRKGQKTVYMYTSAVKKQEINKVYIYLYKRKRHPRHVIGMYAAF